ncbi:HLA class II histocompatibility antigen gamma chain isoform X3 [Empidonax traillii]|uniref:HLA class II histocompatibility antigen gamma chain isoform X3 n=1 Tax=Empidonax traillii TaxID=164674 RepID=UPI000FFD4CF0|nr:HLA class II histocompatibility antigen gamma chain isoform X3 [Empidonax traillii]
MPLWPSGSGLTQEKWPNQPQQVCQGRVGTGGVFPGAELGVLISTEEPTGAMAEEQRDLISDRGSAVLGVGNTQRSVLGRRAALSTLSILVALLIAGQAVTIYFVYQQSGQISKLTKTSQTLQLEALQRKLPGSAKPVNKMKMAIANTPLVMRVLPDAPFADLPAAAPASNKTEDQVKHLLLQADPGKMFPELKDNLLDNLKSLRKTMTHTDWKSFESWMHKWLLFEMAKNPKSEEDKAIPATKGAAAPTSAAATPDPEEMIFSGVDVLKLNAEKPEI